MNTTNIFKEQLKKKLYAQKYKTLYHNFSFDKKILYENKILSVHELTMIESKSGAYYLILEDDTFFVRDILWWIENKDEIKNKNFIKINLQESDLSNLCKPHKKKEIRKKLKLKLKIKRKK